MKIFATASAALLTISALPFTQALGPDVQARFYLLGGCQAVIDGVSVINSQETIEPNKCYDISEEGVGFGSSKAESLTKPRDSIPSGVECTWKTYTERKCPEKEVRSAGPGLGKCANTVDSIVIAELPAGKSWKWECKKVK